MIATYADALGAIRAAIANGKTGVSRNYAAVVMFEVADLGHAGHFLGNDLSGVGYTAEDIITPEELALAAKVMAGMWYDKDYLTFLVVGLDLPGMPRARAAYAVSLVASLGSAGHFPADLTAMDFGQALASLVSDADDIAWLGKLRAALCGASAH